MCSKINRFRSEWNGEKETASMFLWTRSIEWPSLHALFSYRSGNRLSTVYMIKCMCCCCWRVPCFTLARSLIARSQRFLCLEFLTLFDSQNKATFKNHFLVSNCLRYLSIECVYCLFSICTEVLRYFDVNFLDLVSKLEHFGQDLTKTHAKMLQTLSIQSWMAQIRFSLSNIKMVFLLFYL